MSFKVLPPEVKQMIVNEVSRSVKAGRKRLDMLTGGSTQDVFRRTREDQEKSLGRLSLVNKELRTMCAPALFDTLHLFETRDEEFDLYIEDHILKLVRHVVIDNETPEDAIRHFGLNVFRRLPNVDRVSLRAVTYMSPNIEFGDPRVGKARDNMITWTKKVSNWSITMGSANEMPSQFLSQDMSHVRHLSLKVPHFDGLHWLSDGDLSLRENVRNFRNLETLRLAYYSCEGVEHLSIPLFPDYLTESSYPFAETLTSLTIDIGQPYQPGAKCDSSVLAFANLFPNLRHLSISANQTTIMGSNFTAFSNLVELELAFYHYPSFTSFLASISSLPKLRTLRLVFTGDNSFWSTQSKEISKCQVLVLLENINKFGKTPTSDAPSTTPSAPHQVHIHLSASKCAPPPWVTQLFREKLPDSFHFSFDWFEGSPERALILEQQHRHEVKTNSTRTSTTEYLESYEKNREESRNDVVSGVKRLAEYVVQEAERFELVEDRVLPLVMYEILRPLEEYQSWMRD